MRVRLGRHGLNISVADTDAQAARPPGRAGWNDRLRSHVRTLLFRRWLRHRIQATFICGCGHTGSSLLNRILSHHPEIYTPGWETLMFAGTRRNVGELARLFRVAQLQGKRHLLEKSPPHVYAVNTIRSPSLLPGAKFVFMMRDGRDVATSIGRRRHGDYAAGAREWIRAAGRIERHLAEPGTMLFSYERFVDGPEAELRAVCDFIGVPFLPTLLEYHQSPQPYHGHTGREEVAYSDAISDLGLEKLRAYQINQPIFDGRNKWQGELPAEVLRELTEGEGGRLMQRFGYL